MRADYSFAKTLLDHFRTASEDHKLSTNEFVVLHALIYCCFREYQGKLLTPCTSIEVARASNLARETVRRILIKLGKIGLACEVGNLWMLNEKKAGGLSIKSSTN